MTISRGRCSLPGPVQQHAFQLHCSRRQGINPQQQEGCNSVLWVKGSPVCGMRTPSQRAPWSLQGFRLDSYSNSNFSRILSFYNRFFSCNMCMIQSDKGLMWNRKVLCCGLLLQNAERYEHCDIVNIFPGYSETRRLIHTSK